MVLFDIVLGISAVLLAFAYKYFLDVSTFEIVRDMGYLFLTIVLGFAVIGYVLSFSFKQIKKVTRKYIL